MMGIEGAYIRIKPQAKTAGTSAPEVNFIIDSSINESLRLLAQRILAVCADFIEISKFIDARMQFEYGLVNHALCDGLNSLLKDYLVLAAQLETLHNQSKLTLQKFWFYVQPSMRVLQLLKEITRDAITTNARGGNLINLIYNKSVTAVSDKKTEELFTYLLTKASQPYFDMLTLWVYNGVVRDPYCEFCVKQNQIKTNESHFNDAYWEQSYTTREGQVVVFLEKMRNKVLITGKYINFIKECQNYTTQKNHNKQHDAVDVEPRDDKDAQLLLDEKQGFIFSTDERIHADKIERAYKFASKKLLNVLLKDYRMLEQLSTIKNYFLMEQGNFYVQFLDIAEEELKKNSTDIDLKNLQSLFDVALKTVSNSSTATSFHLDTLSNKLIQADSGENTVVTEKDFVGESDEDFTDNLTCTLNTTNFISQLLQILSINQPEETGTAVEYGTKATKPQSLTGLEALSLLYNSEWPLRYLILNEKTMNIYQSIFRHLFSAVVLDRQLGQAWSLAMHTLYRTNIKASEWSILNPAHKLRQRMLHFVQTLQHYMFYEVIEPNWLKFVDSVEKSDTVDDLLQYHETFVQECLKNCLLTDPNMIKIISKLLSVCSIFANYHQRLLKAIAVDATTIQENIAANTSTQSQQPSQPAPSTLKPNTRRSGAITPRGGQPVTVSAQSAANYNTWREREKAKAQAALEQISKMHGDKSYLATMKKFEDNFEQYLKLLLEALGAAPDLNHHLANLSFRLDFNQYYSNKFIQI
jgi:gamma-tubulin complex component 2